LYIPGGLSQKRGVLNFIKRLRKPSVADVLRVAAEVRPSAIPFILFKALFRYPMYLIALLLFVRNIRYLFELFLYRGRVKKLEFRFGLGRHRLDLDYVLVFAELLLRRIFVYSVDGKLLARFKGGVISLPAVGFASLLTEPFEKIYRVFDYKGRVLDVGGYLGETAYLFKKWGAEEVVVYEPEHQLAKHVRETMRLNGVKGVVYESFVGCSTSHNSVGWIDVLKDGFEVAKVDCEVCEKQLLSLPDDLIRKVPKWVIECHGPETLRQLCGKFLKAGFRVTFKPYRLIVVYQLPGREKVFNPQTKLPQTSCLL
jgi:hypothetical protein